jgi:hypothetical protein
LLVLQQVTKSCSIQVTELRTGVGCRARE